MLEKESFTETLYSDNVQFAEVEDNIQLTFSFLNQDPFRRSFHPRQIC